MRKIFSKFMVLMMVLSLTIPVFAAETHEITSAAFPFYLDDIDLGMDVTLYFLDGAKDLPYIEVNDFMPLLNEATIGDEGLGISFTMETEGPQ